VNLRGFDPSGVPLPAAEAVRGFLDALGVPPDRVPPQPEAQAGLYRSLLTDRSMLIVLDNTRDEQQVRPLLPASPASLVVITSRRQLAGLAAAERARLLTLDVLGHDEAVQGQYAEALGHAEQAASLRHGIGDKAGEAEMLNTVGWYHALLGDYPKARGFCRQALALNSDYGSRHLEADIWNSLGCAEHHAGEFSEAAACYERALTIFRAVGDRWGEADTLTNLGDVHRAAGELWYAREAWQQALAVLDDLQHPGAAKIRDKLASMHR
jgi:tetratricopeptide (TPR) repeat protein